MKETTFILDRLLVVKLDATIWGGRKKLHKEDLILGDGSILPPEDLASLGSKKIADPMELAVFNRLKKEAESVLTGAIQSIPNAVKYKMVKIVNQICKMFLSNRLYRKPSFWLRRCCFCSWFPIKSNEVSGKLSVTLPSIDKSSINQVLALKVFSIKTGKALFLGVPSYEAKITLSPIAILLNPYTAEEWKNTSSPSVSIKPLAPL